MEVTFERFSEKFLKLSWGWLNDVEIKFMTNTRDFTKEQQEEWYKTLSGRKDYLIWGINADSIPIGVCGLKNISNIDCEYWGYIGDKNYWDKGIGKEIMRYLEEKARSLSTSSIWLRVIKENSRAIFLYKKQGYIIESEAGNLYVMRKKI